MELPTDFSEIDTPQLRMSCSSTTTSSCPITQWNTSTNRSWIILERFTAFSDEPVMLPDTSLSLLPPNAVLTKVLMTSKDVIDDYLHVFGSKYKDYLTSTHANGEALTLNHHVMSMGQNPNPVRASLNGTIELDGTNGHSTNDDVTPKPGHYELRDNLC